MRVGFLRQINYVCAIMGDSDVTHQKEYGAPLMKLQFLGGAGTRTHRQQRLSAGGRRQICFQKGVLKAREAGAFVYGERRKRSAEAVPAPALSRTLRTSKRYGFAYESTYGDRLHADSDRSPNWPTLSPKQQGAVVLCSFPLLPSGAHRCFCILSTRSWRRAGYQRCRCT